MSNKPIRHATLTFPKPEVHANHPFRNDANHQALLEYVQARLELGKSHRDSKISRYAQIDKDMAGWIRLDDEDRKRMREHERDGTPIAVKTNLPLTFIHIDDMMTYYAQTFAPNRGMFYHTAKPGETSQATQITTIMNNHAIYGGYYRQMLLSIFAILKYNLGGLHTYWATDYGPKLGQDPAGNTTVEDSVMWRGNKAEAIDMYNFLPDPSVHPTQLYKDGEFAAIAKIRSHYWLADRASKGVYFNCEEALRTDNGVGTADYYRHPPQEANLQADDSVSGTGGGINWLSILSAGPVYTANSGFELVECYIKINPNDFGLIDGDRAAKAKRNRYEIWRITLLNNRTIIEAQYMNNVHGFLPFFMGLANDDVMGEYAKSTAETINPLQNFASFLLNTHILATRKNLWGTTYYDPTVIDMDKIPKGEVSARVPMNPAGYGKDIRNAIFHDDHILDTKQTLQDLQSTLQIIDQFFPTQSLPSQIAGIDRAVDSQVAAVQQGANRRQHKGARLLDDSMMRPMRFCMYYNIVQFQVDGEQIPDFYGKPVTVNLSELRQTDLPFIIGQGLKAIDRQAASQLMQQVIFALIQNPQAAQQTDIMGLIDYWTSMMDIDVDMRQFQRQVPAAPADSGVPGSESVAGPETPGIPGGPVQPVTDPSAVTAPIYS